MELATEIFPVRTKALPTLTAYKVDVGDGDVYRVGGKLSYRLRKAFPGRWVWTVGRVVTDTPVRVEEISKVIERLWHEQPAIFKDVRGVRLDENWNPYSRSIAEFVARGMFPETEPEIRRILSEKDLDLGPALVERIHFVRGWVVQNRPAVSISVSSRIVHKQDLKEFAATVQRPEDLIGLWVAAKSSTLKGQVIAISGTLAEHRARLLALTQDEKMQDLLESAPDDEIVVRVLSGRSEYDYVVSSLRLIVRSEDYGRFGIDSKRALGTLRISPDVRNKLVQAISDPARKKGLIGESYNSTDFPDLFPASLDSGAELLFGGNQSRQHDERTVLRNLHQFGLYKKAQRFEEGAPIKVGVINSLGSRSLDNFWPGLQRELRSLRFEASIASTETVRETSRADLERAIESLMSEAPDILLALFPDEYDDDEDSAYNRFKSITVGRGIPSQVVYASTLDNRYAVANIVLGILGKTGNAPFILAKPLEYADIVVGIDIARERKKRLAGSINATAVARIYFSNGEFVRYVIHDAPLEGETVPEPVLQSLFPMNEFKDKRVVIHRDGYFRGDEKQALKSWASKIGAEFHLVEILKTGSPRIYATDGGRTQLPPKGSAFKLNQNEALLVSSLPPFQNATPQPLHVRAEPPFSIKQAVDSVLRLTLLHYGSLRPPRLPVTIHYSDRIAYLVLRGIKPKDLEGNIPFWL